MITYQSCSSAATEKLGENLAKKVLARKLQKHATIIGLSGELGSGKTTFIQGFFRGMGLRKRALSPTFILMRRIKLKKKKVTPLEVSPSAKGGTAAADRDGLLLTGFRHLFHIDAYRLRKPKELLSFGLGHAFRDHETIILIEWADKLKRMLPRNTIWVNFKHGRKERERIIRL